MNEPVPTPNKLLVVLPSWVGDAAMATPTLRALRGLYPQARITYLLKEYVRPVIDGSPWYDRLVVARPGGGRVEGEKRRRPLVSRLRRKGFDAAVLLTNSFRSAFLVSRAGIGRRIGYDRDGRGLLLTDRLIPMRSDGRYVPVSAVDYYLGLAQYLGSRSDARRLELFTRPEDDARADRLLTKHGVGGGGSTSLTTGGSPLVYLNPGAATKGGKKNWPADRFAGLADALAAERGATLLLGGSPKERETLDAVRAAARCALIDLPGAGVDLTLSKSILRRCSLVVTNDTGARHLAAGLGVPVVSLFGPTDPRWATLDYDRERIVRAADGEMSSIGVGEVLEACRGLLPERTGARCA